MKRTVKTCNECSKLFIVYSNVANGEVCKNCRSLKQKKDEDRLLEYLQSKYGNNSLLYR